MSSISLFNLNIMHGRNLRSPIFPLWVSRQRAQDNLQKIADLINEYDSDTVTLQEVDQVSVLSGDFNQFDYLGERLHYAYKFFSPSCSVRIFGKSIFVSGNAIFSKYPLENCESFKFDFSFPTERQGFVIADVKLPNGLIFAITSIHLVYLDWLRLNSRIKQLNVIRRVIEKREKEVVISGDINCDFFGKEISLRSFVNQLNLKVYEPENKNLNTYPSWSPAKRIDWILSSKELNFISYKTISTRVSDHLAVFADLNIT